MIINRHLTININCRQDSNVRLLAVGCLVFAVTERCIYKKVLTGNIREPTIRGAPVNIYKRRMFSFLERRNI